MSGIFPSKFHKDLLLTQLRTLGVAKVVVEFSGSGDSGNIDSAYCRDANGNTIELPDTTFDWPKDKQVFDRTTELWNNQRETLRMDLNDILIQTTENALQEHDIDWYNNEGGQGKLTIDFNTSPPTIELDVGINVVTTEDFNFNFSDECEE